MKNKNISYFVMAYFLLNSLGYFNLLLKIDITSFFADGLSIFMFCFSTLMLVILIIKYILGDENDK